MNFEENWRCLQLSHCFVWFILFTLLLMLSFSASPVVLAQVSDNDKMLVNEFPQLFTCVLNGSPDYFSVGNFLSTMLNILSTLPNGEFKGSEQLELFEYCWWANTTLDGYSYCRNGGKVLSNANYTLVRYGVAVSDPVAVLNLGYTALNSSAGPLLQTSDPALYVPGDVTPSFVRVILANNVVTNVLSILIVIIFVFVLVGVITWRLSRDRLQEKARTELLQRTIATSSISDPRPPSQSNAWNNRELDTALDSTLECGRREFHWGGMDVELSNVRASSYWPSTTNDQQSLQRKEWHEQELGIKPSNVSNQKR